MTNASYQTNIECDHKEKDSSEVQITQKEEW